MFDKLADIKTKFEEVESRLSDGAVISDREAYSALMKEHKRLLPIVEKYNEYEKYSAQQAEAKELLDTEKDRELRELAEAEYLEAKEKLETISDELKILLLPRDENDDKNVIVEIRAGAGGDEAALFAGSLYRMYTMYADTHGFKHEVLNISETGLGGIKEISFEISGDGAFSKLKFESGVHRVQRVPETESGGRIHTSTVTVAVLPEAEETEVNIDPSDLQIDTYRSGGAGGQHVNKTESAIRITHIPTGIVVECQDERSQYKNKDRAMKILYSRILEQEREKQMGEIAAERRSQVGTGDRSERIRTYNFPQGRVTDHRIGLSLYKIDAIMNGDLDEIITSLITADQARKLAAAE